MANLPVPSPRTFTVGETETGAYLNTVRDGLSFLTAVPIARLHQASVQTLTNNTYILTALDATDLDIYGGHSNTTNNSRYTFQAAGAYLLSGGVSTSTNTTGFRLVSFRLNGSATYHKTQAAPSPSFETVLGSVALLQVNAGDYVELGSWQNSGSGLSTVVTDQSVWPWMDVFWAHS